MVDAERKPQILEHLRKSLNVTIHGLRWIPGTARIAAVGAFPNGKGCLQVYELDRHQLRLVAEASRPHGLKCATFGAAPPNAPQLATGGFDGALQVWDLERVSAGGDALYTARSAHGAIVNAVDGFGGRHGAAHGPPELVTGGRDGAVRVWDVRQAGAPVAAFEPADAAAARDCWCVAFGDAHGADERCVLAGYDNGDVKLFDLRTGKVRWERNVQNGVCGVAFDRAEIPMNKLLVACLEGELHAFDARTQHPKKGFAGTTASLGKGSTVWGAAPLPQDRDVCAAHCGDGALVLCRYRYPDKRRLKDQDGAELGVAGTLEVVARKDGFAEQAVNAFDWSPDRRGLFASAALDQCLRVGIVTKLDRL